MKDSQGERIAPGKTGHARAQWRGAGGGGALITVLSLAALSVSPALGQSYEVTWYTIDNGGVLAASSTTYQASGTIGQHDAGELAGTTYTVTGGFCIWTLGSGCVVADAPVAEPSVPDMGYGTRVRYVSFSAGTPGRQEAIRVTLTASTLFPEAVGQQWWVGHPSSYSECCGYSPSTFWAAPLQCDPYYTDWSVYNAVHIDGGGAYTGATVPDATYELQAIHVECDTDVEDYYSAPLSVTTSKWGDIIGNCPVPPCIPPTPPNGTVSFEDITAVVDTFKSVYGAPRVSRSDISPALVDHTVDFTDIGYEVDAFRGLPYPFGAPEDCGTR